jgi:hypothetical protein
MIFRAKALIIILDIMQSKSDETLGFIRNLADYFA